MVRSIYLCSFASWGPIRLQRDRIPRSNAYLWISKKGPIVRISPDELHINDITFFEDFYTKLGPQDKYPWMFNRLGNMTSFNTTASHSLHKLRRAPLARLFSRQQIRSLQPMIWEKVDKLLNKLQLEYQEENVPVCISNAYMSLAQDVIFDYCFAMDPNVLDNPGFEGNLHPAFVALGGSGLLATHFPWIPKIMEKLPQAWVVKLQPLLALVFKVQNVSFKQEMYPQSFVAFEYKSNTAYKTPKPQDIERLAVEVEQGKTDAHLLVDHRTVLAEFVHSNLPPSEKTGIRLRSEAFSLIGAGLATTGWAESVATFYIANDPKVYAKLHAELKEAIPDPKAPLDWMKLEQLPYLQGCIREALRLSYGMSTRSPRLNHESFKYKEWTIPAWTPVSLSIPDASHDERIFPDSHSFIPERWIDSPGNMEKYFVFFGKGPRGCFGKQYDLTLNDFTFLAGSCIRANVLDNQAGARRIQFDDCGRVPQIRIGPFRDRHLRCGNGARHHNTLPEARYERNTCQS